MAVTLNPSDNTTQTDTTDQYGTSEQPVDGANGTNGADGAEGSESAATSGQTGTSYNQAVEDGTQATSANTSTTTDTTQGTCDVDEPDTSSEGVVDWSDGGEALEELQNYKSTLDYGSLSEADKARLAELTMQAADVAETAAQLSQLVDTAEPPPPPPPPPEIPAETLDAKQQETQEKEKEKQEKYLAKYTADATQIRNTNQCIIKARVKGLNNEAVVNKDIKEQAELKKVQAKLYDIKSGESKELTPRDFAGQGDGFCETPEMTPDQRLKCLTNNNKPMSLANKAALAARTKPDASGNETHGECLGPVAGDTPLTPEQEKQFAAARQNTPQPKTRLELQKEAETDKARREAEKAQAAADAAQTADPGQKHIINNVLPGMVRDGLVSEQYAKEYAERAADGMCASAEAVANGTENAALSTAIARLHGQQQDQGQGGDRGHQRANVSLVSALCLAGRSNDAKRVVILTSQRADGMGLGAGQNTTTERVAPTYTPEDAKYGLSSVEDRGRTPEFVPDDDQDNPAREEHAQNRKAKAPVQKRLAKKEAVPAKELIPLEGDFKA